MKISSSIHEIPTIRLRNGGVVFDGMIIITDLILANRRTPFLIGTILLQSAVPFLYVYCLVRRDGWRIIGTLREPTAKYNTPDLKGRQLQINSHRKEMCVVVFAKHTQLKRHFGGNQIMLRAWNKF